MRRCAGLIALVVIAIPAVGAQSSLPPAGTSPLEVVSIKTNRSGSGGTVVRTDRSGRFTMTNGSVMTLLLNAYAVHAFTIDGAPDWLSTERYDVDARAGREVSPADWRELLKGMLADRFHLVAHIEQREVPVLLLVRAAQAGPLGSSLRPWTIDCAGPNRDACGMNAAQGLLHMRGYRLEMLATSLSSSMQQRVLDNTGLNGEYDIKLQWAPDDRGPQDLPSLPMALQEQLGLKLQPARRAADVLVIDRIDRPTEN